MDLDLVTSAGIVILSGVGTLLAHGLREYVSGFKRKEGELDALQRNLPKVLAQLEATTATAKRIEVQFNATLWLEQQKWPLKRETYALLIEHVRSLIWFLHQTRELAATQTPTEIVNQEKAEELERTMQWAIDIGDVGELRTTAVTLGMDRALAILNKLGPHLRSVSVTDPATIDAAAPHIVAIYRELLAASREDLGGILSAGIALASESGSGRA